MHGAEYQVAEEKSGKIRRGTRKKLKEKGKRCKRYNGMLVTLFSATTKEAKDQ